MKIWTPEKSDTLIALRRAGRTFGEIAKEMGMSRKSVIGQARKQGLTGHDVSPADLSEAARLARVEEIKKKHRDRQRGYYQAKSAERAKRQRFRSPRKPRPYPVGPEPEAIGPVCDFGPGCKWIHGEPASGAWRECGHPKTGEGPYCTYHDYRAHNPPPPADGSPCVLVGGSDPVLVKGADAALRAIERAA